MRTKYGYLATANEQLQYEILQELIAIRELLTPKEVVQDAKPTELPVGNPESIGNSKGSRSNNTKQLNGVKSNA